MVIIISLICTLILNVYINMENIKSLCFVCNKPVHYGVIPISNDNYPNLTELRILEEHHRCRKLYDKKVSLEHQLLNIEWKLFKLKDPKV